MSSSLNDVKRKVSLELWKSIKIESLLKPFAPARESLSQAESQ